MPNEAQDTCSMHRFEEENRCGKPATKWYRNKLTKNINSRCNAHYMDLSRFALRNWEEINLGVQIDLA